MILDGRTWSDSGLLQGPRFVRPPLPRVHSTVHNMRDSFLQIGSLSAATASRRREGDSAWSGFIAGATRIADDVVPPLARCAEMSRCTRKADVRNCNACLKFDSKSARVLSALRDFFIHFQARVSTRVQYLVRYDCSKHIIFTYLPVKHHNRTVRSIQ